MAIPQNNNRFLNQIQETQVNRNLVYAILILGALVFFEVFNFSTTDFALRDLLGDLKFIGIPWATTLAIAFCAIDFAGIARLFTPETGRDEPKEVWYLFSAWLLAATMNASLTWWGVSMAIANHTVLSTSIVEAGTIMKVVPIFVALLVWVIRVLVIGTLSVAGEHLFRSQPEQASRMRNPQNTSRTRINPNDAYPSISRPRNSMPSHSPMTARPARSENQTYRMSSPSQARQRREPSYHNMNTEFSSDNTPEPAQTNGASQAKNTRHFS